MPRCDSDGQCRPPAAEKRLRLSNAFLTRGGPGRGVTCGPQEDLARIQGPGRWSRHNDVVLGSTASSNRAAWAQTPGREAGRWRGQRLQAPGHGPRTARSGTCHQKSGKAAAGPPEGRRREPCPGLELRHPSSRTGRGRILSFLPPSWGTIVAAAWATYFTLESASGHLSPSQPNTSQEPNQAMASKLPNVQKAVAPRATGRSPIRPAPGDLAPRPHPMTRHRLCLGPVVRLSEDSGVHA